MDWIFRAEQIAHHNEACLDFNIKEFLGTQTHRTTASNCKQLIFEDIPFGLQLV